MIDAISSSTCRGAYTGICESGKDFGVASCKVMRHVEAHTCGTGELIGDSGIVSVYDFGSLPRSGEAVPVTTLQVASTPSGAFVIPVFISQRYGRAPQRKGRVHVCIHAWHVGRYAP